jgi:hypothetical protein
MYAARFEFNFGAFRVFAGRMKAGAQGLVPPRLLQALSLGRVSRLALRSHFDAGGQQAVVLVPCNAEEEAGPMQALLDEEAEVDWCTGAAAFDALAATLGPHRRWLDGSGIHVQGTPCAVEASWMPDWALLRRLGEQQALVHQVNLVHEPASVEQQRWLRKHLVRLDLLAEQASWPASRLQAQRRLVERRLSTPWLVDEVLACASADACRVATAPLCQRLAEQGGAGLADALAQSGEFDELLQTGLDSGCFLTPDPVAVASRSMDAAALWAALGQRDGQAQARPTDAFISHASADAAAAIRVCAQLEAGGMRCWIAPRDIAAGRHYAEVIDDALRGSRAIVLLLSEAAMDSPHVLRELERAVNHRVLVLPLRLSALQARHAFGYLLSGCQWTDALPGHDEAAIAQRLLSALARRP